jgi:hypothetical protein
VITFQILMFLEPDPATQTRGSSVSTSTDHATLLREDSSYRKWLAAPKDPIVRLALHKHKHCRQTYIRILKQFQDLQIVSLGVG